jgi:hypothetical protein
MRDVALSIFWSVESRYENRRIIMVENMLDISSDQDLEEYKKNACEILYKNTQYATRKIVEELFNKELEMRKLIRILNTIPNS